MVHALEQIHSLLVPNGHLIDIHPNGELVEFIYSINEQEHFIGHMQETDDYIEYHQADEAIQTAIEKRLFKVVKTKEFEFRTYGDSFEELKSFLDENWSDSVITEDVLASARKLEDKYGVCKTFLREQIWIGLLKCVTAKRP